jgi:4-amino-4-deoxy-L-arabinose transferase-like glycosyltransferase
MVAGLAWLRGSDVDALAVRLPAAISAWLCVMLLYGWGNQIGRPILGFCAALILATSAHFTWMAKIARVDMPLTLFCTAALLAMWVRMQRDTASKWWLVFAYLAMGLAVLMKGPIGLVLPLAVIIVYGALNALRDASRQDAALPSLSVKRLGLSWGIPLVLAVSVPCFVWAHYHTSGEFTRTFFLYHNVQRGFGSETLAEHPWWFYVPRSAIDLLPWILLLPFAMWRVLKGRFGEASLTDRVGEFGATWFVVMLAVLSLARFKRSDYLLPAYPGVALLLACYLEKLLLRASRPRLIWGGVGAVAAACVLAWVYYVDVSLPAEESRREYQTFAAEIREFAPAPETVYFFRTESHALAFHVSRPVRTFVEWEDLDRLASGPEPAWVVTRPEVARQWREHLTHGQLEEVGGTDRDGVHHEKPLVLFRTRPNAVLSLHVSDERRSPEPPPDRTKSLEFVAPGAQ